MLLFETLQSSPTLPLLLTWNNELHFLPDLSASFASTVIILVSNAVSSETSSLYVADGLKIGAFSLTLRTLTITPTSVVVAPSDAKAYHIQYIPNMNLFKKHIYMYNQQCIEL